MMISANGLTLHAEETGAGDLALVFLHYWGGTARTWKPVIDALPTYVRSIALDARGWGGSDRPHVGYDIATMADDVAAAIASLGLKRYVLVGHSMGGKVAQLLASRCPPGLVGLILVAPSPAGGKNLSDTEREGMRGAYATTESIAWTIDNVLAERPLSSSLREEIIAGSLSGATAAKDSWPLAAISEDVSADLANISVPVLVIGGERDKVDGVDMLRTIVVPSLPNAVMTVIPGVGHLLPLEAPREVADRIADFIDKDLHQQSRVAFRPEDVPGAFDAAFNDRDLDALMALFHPEAIMRMTDGTLVASGPNALREPLQHLIALQPRLRNTVRRVLVSGTIALLLLDWEIRIGVAGDSDVTERGTATQVIERSEDGVWRLRIANPLGVN